MTYFLIKKCTENICELTIETPPSRFTVKLRDTDLERLKKEIHIYEEKGGND